MLTIEEVKEQLKQNFETGKSEAYFRAAGLTDEQVEQCLNVCKKALEGYYGDDIFDIEKNVYFGICKLEGEKEE